MLVHRGGIPEVYNAKHWRGETSIHSREAKYFTHMPVLLKLSLNPTTAASESFIFANFWLNFIQIETIPMCEHSKTLSWILDTSKKLIARDKFGCTKSWRVLLCCPFWTFIVHLQSQGKNLQNVNKIAKLVKWAES